MLRKTPPGVRWWALALLFALSPACSSQPANEDPGRMPSEPDPSVFDACVAFAERLCEDAQGCCEATYGAFEHAGCVETFRRDVCRPGADAVTAGRATFDEHAVEACLAAHAQAHRVCTPTWPQTLELRRAIYTACRVIDGLSPPGAGCSRSATCKRPEGLATAECVKNRCVTIELLAEGARCPFPDGAVSVCDVGLACDAAGLGTEGVCVRALATGASCNGSVLEGTECGLGNYCDLETATCQVTENMGGSGCAQSTECVSFDCDRLAGECAAAPAVLGRDTCLGPED
jgi:hypothetical protein